MNPDWVTLCLFGLKLSNNPVQIHSPPLRCSLTLCLVGPSKHKVNEHLSGGEWIRTGLLESIKPTKHKLNEHLSGGEWIWTGLLESIKPTLCLLGLILSNNPVQIHSPPLRCSLSLCLGGLIHKVNEHLNGGEWIWTGLLESIKPTKHKVNVHLS
jgi:ABC-type cobalamin transport system ATPase subunit